MSFVEGLKLTSRPLQEDPCTRFPSGENRYVRPVEFSTQQPDSPRPMGCATTPLGVPRRTYKVTFSNVPIHDTEEPAPKVLTLSFPPESNSKV